MPSQDAVGRPMNAAEFESLMSRLATAWSTGDVQTAVDCFAADIVYVEPPDRQRYVGREAIFRLSGGSDPPPMSMTWHHLIFDPATSVGVGEYTFRGRRQYHGMAIVQCADGRIRRWREFQYVSDLDWASFVGDSRFEYAP